MVHQEGIKAYYQQKIEESEVTSREKTMNLRRLEAQRNELNAKGTATISLLELTGTSSTVARRTSIIAGTRYWTFLVVKKKPN
jgi:hypothetical protein